MGAGRPVSEVSARRPARTSCSTASCQYPPRDPAVEVGRSTTTTEVPPGQRSSHRLQLRPSRPGGDEGGGRTARLARSPPRSCRDPESPALADHEGFNDVPAGRRVALVKRETSELRLDHEVVEAPERFAPSWVFTSTLNVRFGLPVSSRGHLLRARSQFRPRGRPSEAHGALTLALALCVGTVWPNVCLQCGYCQYMVRSCSTHRSPT